MIDRLRRKPDLLIALAVALAGFFLYALTVAPSVLFADSGEYQFVTYIAGIAHSTGYPLYCMLGWVWTHVLPFGQVALRMNLFSVVWGAVTIGLTYAVALQAFQLAASDCPLALRRALGVLVAFLVAVSATFWSQAVIAESCTLNAAFVVAVLYLALRLWESVPEGRPTRWLIALAAVYGLSLTHHRTMILLLPALLVFLWIVIRRTGWGVSQALRLTLPGLLLPQILYLYIPWRAAYTPYVELTLDPGRTLTLYSRSLSGFLDLVLGRAFAADLARGPLDATRLGMIFDLWLPQFGWVGIALGLIGLLALVRRRAWLFLTLTAISFAAYIMFSAVYFIADVYPLLVPAYLIWALWIALGVWEIAAGVSTLIVRGKTSAVPPLNFQRGYQTIVGGAKMLAAGPVILLAFALPIVLGFSHLPAADQSGNHEAEQMWQTILAQPIPQGAVLISNDRDEIMPLWYYQYVNHVRPDLLGLFPLIVRDPGYQDVSGVIDQALSSRRPVLLVKPMPGLELKYRLEPRGPLVQVSASSADRRPAHPLDLAVGESVRLIGYDLAPEHPGPGQTATVRLYWQPVRGIPAEYSSFVHLANLSGKTIIKEDHQLGGVYYPTTLWKPGEVLLDVHPIEIPIGTPAGSYAIIAGLYAWPSMDRPGPEVVIGQVTF